MYKKIELHAPERFWYAFPGIEVSMKDNDRIKNSVVWLIGILVAPIIIILNLVVTLRKRKEIA